MMIRLFDENHYSIQILSIVDTSSSEDTNLSKVLEMVQFQYNAQFGENPDNLNLMVVNESKDSIKVYILDLKVSEETVLIPDVSELYLLVDNSDGLSEAVGVLLPIDFYKEKISSKVLID